MREHYDVGQVGCWYWGNYGSLLNGYATYSLLKSFGLSVLNIVTPYNGFEEHAKKFFEAVYTQDEISPALPFERVAEYNQVCGAFLTGSDQIWHFNPRKDNHRYDMYFHLDFADDVHRKVSFATSFGRYVLPPDHIREQFARLFQRYAAISVRESEAVEILKNVYGVRAEQVLEPVLDIPAEQWLEIAERSEYREQEPYMLTYILDPTPQKREAVLYYSRELGVKTINILDGFSRAYEHNRAALDLPGTLPPVWCADLLKLFSGASFVISDSFHGACFSLLFNRPFLSIGNYVRGLRRFESLLSLVGMENRLITDEQNIPHDRALLEKIDFACANEVIARERQRSVAWLESALLSPLENLPSVRIEAAKQAVTYHLESGKCVGCGACVYVCPKDALSLQPDMLGYYRSTLDERSCVNCGLCTKVCPVLHPPTLNTENPDCYEFVAADWNTLISSSSGGAFPVLAREAFRRAGTVGGAAWREDFSVGHILIERQEDLPKLQKSKYLQSYMGDIGRQVRAQLEEGRFVLFIGCPCQIAGLKSYLQKDYENLILVDLLCFYSPSAKFFEKHLQEEFPDGIQSYTFRYKSDKHKWTGSIVKVTDVAGNEHVYNGAQEDHYRRAYLYRIMCSEHCQNCHFQSARRFGDLTIGDFWSVGKRDPAVDHTYGVSCLLANNEKGRRYLESIPESEYSLMKKIPYAWLDGNGMTKNGKNFASPARDDFYQAIRVLPFSKAADFALKPDRGEKRLPFPPEQVNPVQFSAKMSHFRFSPEYWNELTVDGRPLLYVRSGQWKLRRYATLPLCKTLLRQRSYDFAIRFKAKSAAKTIHFYVKDSGTHLTFEIASYAMTPSASTDWVEVKGRFTPDSDLYDELMIGASQFTGEGNFITFEYIYITETRE